MVELKVNSISFAITLAFKPMNPVARSTPRSNPVNSLPSRMRQTPSEGARRRPAAPAAPGHAPPRTRASGLGQHAAPVRETEARGPRAWTCPRLPSVPRPRRPAKGSSAPIRATVVRSPPSRRARQAPAASRGPVPPPQPPCVPAPASPGRPADLQPPCHAGGRRGSLAMADPRAAAHRARRAARPGSRLHRRRAAMRAAPRGREREAAHLPQPG